LKDTIRDNKSVPVKATVKDIDGNIYNIVTIGSQCWMKENLRTKHYSDGSSIATGLTNDEWQFARKRAVYSYEKVPPLGAYEVYGNNASNDSIYGKLYNWFAVADNRGLCPSGWHVPSNNDWNLLFKTIGASEDIANENNMYRNRSEIIGGAMKEINLTHWSGSNTGATNISSFTGLPGGQRHNDGEFIDIGYSGYWWSSTHYSNFNDETRAFNLELFSEASYGDFFTNYKTKGFSVRCVKD
jgi:uncharacterized protein (TIGR02145 family)